MPRVALLALILLATTTRIALADNESPAMLPPGDTKRTFVSTWDDSEQPYRLFIPEGLSDAPAPLAVVLHGKFVDHNAWLDLTPVAQYAQQFGYVIAAPYARGDYWYRGPAENDVLDIIDDVARHTPIDPDRVYLMGHSMGGWGTMWIGLRHPDRFAGLAPMCGWAPEDLLLNARTLSPFLLHDALDPIVPVENFRATAAQLASMGISVNYREESQFGHGSALIGANLPRVFAWFDTLRRDPVPTRIEFATRSPHSAGKAWWLRVHDLDDFPHAGIIRARIEGEELIIETDGVRALAVHPPTPISVVRLNGEELDVPPDVPHLRILQSHQGWIITADSADTPPPVPSPLQLPWADPIDDSDIVAFTQQWGNLLRRHANADLALFWRDNFRHMGDPASVESVASTWAYPVEVLALFRVEGAALRNAMEKDAQLVLVQESLDTAIDLAATHVVLAPINMESRLGVAGEPLPTRADRMLIDAVRAATRR